jgi:hypothetical protein
MQIFYDVNHKNWLRVAPTPVREYIRFFFLIASLSGWATEKIVMSSKVEAAEAAAKIAQQKQSEAKELSTEKGFHQALCRERQKLEAKEMQWLEERAELNRKNIEVRQFTEAKSRNTRDSHRAQTF